MADLARGAQQAPRRDLYGNRSPEYRCWLQLRRRCSDRNDKGYKRYGARGIYVCERWRNSFPAFFSDMGKRPSSKHSIDRIDNNGPYSAENCRWATRVVQNNNRSTNRHLTYNGHTMTVTQWARTIGINYFTLNHRLNLGWSIRRALEEPARRYTLTGVSHG